MGRPPVFKKGPMTAAERQRRHRKKLRTQRSAEARRNIAKRNWDGNALKYMPMPPGITYWHQVAIRASQEVTVWQPDRVPLPMLDDELDDGEIIHLLGLLNWQVEKRGLPVDWETLLPVAPSRSGIGVFGSK
jgi:hypothetical protein